METSFNPSPDVAVIINTLIDKFENRAKHNKKRAARTIRVSLTELILPSYFSQTDPSPRLIANEQLSQLEKAGILNLSWFPGEKGNLLQSITLQIRNPALSMDEGTQYEFLYTLLNREPTSTTRSRLESLLLADQFRFSKDDWRASAIQHILTNLRAGKSPAPFSLTDPSWNLDLLTVISALSQLETETPYRVFSVRTFNNSKRFDELRPAIVRLARLTHPEWKSLGTEDILRELSLVANPGYIHLAGNWQLTTQTGEILLLGGFIPSMGFPSAQIETIESVTVHADCVLCIENLTSFHEFIRPRATCNIQHKSCYTRPATICLMGNPSPSIRHLLRLIPEKIPIHLWSDMDYGGFNILSHLRRTVSIRLQPYLMDIPTFEKSIHLSRPLTQMDVRNLRRLLTRPEMVDVRSIIEHLIHRGYKLEQEAIQL